jgi:hypothetical protein
VNKKTEQFTCNFSWGVWTAYFGKDYMPEYDFSGRVYAENGEINSINRIKFVYDAWGPFIRQCRYLPYNSTSFTSHIHNWFDGIRISGSGTEQTVLGLETNMGTLRFTLGELWEKKHLSLPVGEPYSLALIHAEGDDPWYLEAFPPEERILRPGDFTGGTGRAWFNVFGRCLGPGETMTLTEDSKLEFNTSGGEASRYICRMRFLLNGDTEQEVQTRGTARFSLYLNGNHIWSNSRFSTFQDIASQFLEEIKFTVPESLVKDKNSLEIRNLDKALSILIPLVGIRREALPALEITGAPRWGLQGLPFAVSLTVSIPAAYIDIRYDQEVLDFAIREDARSTHPLKQKVAGLNTIEVNEAAIRVLDQGEHVFYFIPKKWAPETVITFTDLWSGAEAKVRLADIYEVPDEPFHCLTGAELRTGSPNDYLGELKRFRNEQIADLVIFRDYHNDGGNPAKLWEAAAFCRQNSMAVDAIIMDDQAIVAAAAAGNCLCVGTHEHTGIFYGRDPILDAGYTMKEAAEVSVDKLRQVADVFRIKGVPVAVGDATGGSRYAYMAGFDIIRHETFSAHHMLILPNARGAARAFGKSLWGAHIATQHNNHPELEYGVRRLYLGVYLSWIMGAGFLYEEDSQFQYFKSNKMAGGDYLPFQINEVMKEFYRYNRTHPRRGQPLVSIAILQGRYAPPVSGLSNVNNGLDTGAFTNENYPVWGHTGNKRWSWGYRQCEKGLHLLEILSPGICLVPLHQRSEKVRRFFSGSPWGEYDFLPVEAELPVFSSYRLLLLLDWHTMTDDGSTGDYEKLYRYARGGGVVFLSVPQLSTRTDRELLEDMRDLKLYKDGAVEELCGVRIKGPSEHPFGDIRFEGAWADLAVTPYEGLRLPNRDDDEDGPCLLAETELCGAVPLITDPEGRPVLVCHSTGTGMVYLLCTYAYPGHERLKALMPLIVRRLLAAHGGTGVSVTGTPGEVNDVYYSLWEEGGEPDKLYLLNTDWRTEKNTKQIVVNTPAVSAPIAVKEGELTEISLFDTGMILTEDGRRDVSITLVSKTPHERTYHVFALREFRLRIVSTEEIQLIADDIPLPAQRGGDPGYWYTLPAGPVRLRLMGRRGPGPALPA